MSNWWRGLLRLMGLDSPGPLSTVSTHRDRDDAIRAALDDLQPGHTLTVHRPDCDGPADACTCNPEIWTYPKD